MAARKTATKDTVDPMLSVIKNIEKNVGNKDLTKLKLVRGNQILTQSSSTIYSFNDEGLDAASSCGGIPSGKVVEIYGPESGGKSYLTLKLIANAQKQGKACCLIDAEQSYDPKWAAKAGVNVDDIFILNESLPGEKILDYMYEVANSGAFGLVVLDSTAALVPQKELDGSIGDQDYALIARAMSKACRKIVAACGKTGTTAIFLNQIREKMGVSYGSNEVTPGGKALKFYSHIRIDVRTKSINKDPSTELPVSKTSRAKFIKNKLGIPYLEAFFDIVFDAKFLNPVYKLVTFARSQKFVKLSKGMFTISKEVFKTAKNIPTGATDMLELADYLVKEKKVVDFINKIQKLINEDEDSEVKIPQDVLAMLKDESMIVSPLDADEVKKRKAIVNVVGQDAVHNLDDSEDEDDDFDPDEDGEENEDDDEGDGE